MLAHVKSVLNFSAFRPEPDDPDYGWKNRFPGAVTALLHAGRSTLSFVLIDAKGQPVPGASARGEWKEALAEVGPRLVEETDDGWCAVSLDTRYVISIETNLSRKKGSEEAVKKDPRSVLHARYEKGKRYAVTHNPETNSSLLLSCDEETIKKIETLCREQRIKIGRLFCGTYVLLRHCLTLSNKTKGSENPLSALYIVCCGGSVCALWQERDNWMELRSRPDVYGGDEGIQGLLDLVAPFQERIGPDAAVVVACDEPMPEFSEKLPGIFPGRTINDLTEPGLLAKIINSR